MDKKILLGNDSIAEDLLKEKDLDEIEKIEKVRVLISIDKDVYEGIKKVARKKGYYYSFLINELLKEFLNIKR